MRERGSRGSRLLTVVPFERLVLATGTLAPTREDASARRAPLLLLVVAKMEARKDAAHQATSPVLIARAGAGVGW